MEFCHYKSDVFTDDDVNSEQPQVFIKIVIAIYTHLIKPTNVDRMKVFLGRLSTTSSASSLLQMTSASFRRLFPVMSILPAFILVNRPNQFTPEPRANYSTTRTLCLIRLVLSVCKSVFLSGTSFCAIISLNPRNCCL